MKEQDGRCDILGYRRQLAVTDISMPRLAAQRNIDRYANKPSLYPPQAALGNVPSRKYLPLYYIQILFKSQVIKTVIFKKIPCEIFMKSFD